MILRVPSSIFSAPSLMAFLVLSQVSLAWMGEDKKDIKTSVVINFIDTSVLLMIVSRRRVSDKARPSHLCTPRRLHTVSNFGQILICNADLGIKWKLPRVMLFKGF